MLEAGKSLESFATHLSLETGEENTVNGRTHRLKSGASQEAGNNARNWIIRHREPKSVLVGHGSGSTIAKLSLRNDLLTTGIGVKGRSSPL